jgi:hypothetical protein
VANDGAALLMGTVTGAVTEGCTVALTIGVSL